MKKIFIPFFLFFAVFCYADETDTSYFIENESGTLKVTKENVAEIKKDIDFTVSEKTVEAQPVIVMNSVEPVADMRSFKNDPNYFAYRHYFSIGLGFLIPGLVLTVSPLLFTPFVVLGFNEHNKNSAWDSADNAAFVYGISSYFTCIGIGVIFDLISIPMFCIANKYYKRILEKYRVGVDVRDDAVEISMNVAF